MRKGTDSEVVVAVEGHDEQDLVLVSECGNDLRDVAAASVRSTDRQTRKREGVSFASGKLSEIRAPAERETNLRSSRIEISFSIRDGLDVT